MTKDWLSNNGFVAGGNNASENYKVWKKATYNPATNSIDYDIKTFQAMKEDVPLDFIFIYDDSITMFDANRWAPRNLPGESLVRIVEAQGTRIIILEAAKALLSDAANNGYDIRVAAGGAADGDTSNSVEANNGGWYGPGDYDDLEEYLATYHGGPNGRGGGVTDHTVGANNAYYMAKASHDKGRTPIVIYLSDFVDGGGTAAFRQRVKPLMDQIHGWGKVYGLKTIGLGDNFRTDTICTDNNHLYFMRDEFPQGVRQLEVIIKDAIGYYMKDKVTVTDNLSDALGELTPGEATKDTGTAAQSAGKSTWTLGGTSPYPGSGQIYTETFSVALNDETVYAGSMPTNGKATVSVGGREVNKIEPSDDTPDKLHMSQPVTFLLGELDKKGRLQADPSTGIPTAPISGVSFTLQEAEKNSAGIYTVKSGASSYAYTTAGELGSFAVPYQVTSGGNAQVILERGKSYLLTESLGDYNTTAAANNKNRLVAPDQSWVVSVDEKGIVTVSVNGNAGQTPKSTVAKAAVSDSTATPAVEGHPAYVVLWNQIVVDARLIPIKIQKTWNGGTERPSVPFTVYGVSGTEKYPLPAYSGATVDTAQVKYLSASECTVTTSGESTVWTRTVYVPESIEEGGNTITFYTDDSLTESSLRSQFPNEIIKVDDTEYSLTNFLSSFGDGTSVIVNQTYSYAVTEEALTYENGWYIGGTIKLCRRNSAGLFSFAKMKGLRTASASGQKRRTMNASTR